MLRTYLITLSGIALGQILPGPNLLAVAGVALQQGRRRAAYVALGTACAVLVWVAAVGLGLGALMAALPWMLDAMRVAGGTYLLWLAARAIKSAASGVEVSFKSRDVELTPFSAWRRGLLINISNPKAAVMWAAVATFLYGSGMSTGEVLGIGPLGAVSAFTIYGTFAAVCATGTVRRGYARFARRVELLFGILFGAIGVELLLSVGSRWWK